MEWLVAGAFALSMLVWAGVFLITKLLKFRPIVKKLEEQSRALAQASQSAPEVAKLASALNDDPLIHATKRLAIQREARRLKRQRERRLRDRVFHGR